MENQSDARGLAHAARTIEYVVHADQASSSRSRPDPPPTNLCQTGCGMRFSSRFCAERHSEVCRELEGVIVLALCCTLCSYAFMLSDVTDPTDDPAGAGGGDCTGTSNASESAVQTGSSCFKRKARNNIRMHMRRCHGLTGGRLAEEMDRSFLAECKVFEYVGKRRVLRAVQDFNAVVRANRAKFSSAAPRDPELDGEIQRLSSQAMLSDCDTERAHLYRKWFQSDEEMLAAAKERAPVSAMLREAIRDWIEYAHGCIKVMERVRPQVLSVRRAGFGIANDTDESLDIDHHRFHKSLAPMTLDKRMSAFCALVAFYCKRAMGVEFDSLLNMTALHPVNAVQNILQSVLANSILTPYSPPVPLAFLHVFSVQTNDTGSEVWPVSLHVLTHWSAAQLWMLRSAWICHALESKKHLHFSSGTKVLQDWPIAEHLYMMHALLRTTVPSAEHSAWITTNEKQNFAMLHRKSNVLVKSHIFGVMYKYCMRSCSTILQMWFNTWLATESLVLNSSFDVVLEGGTAGQARKVIAGSIKLHVHKKGNPADAFVRHMHLKDAFSDFLLRRPQEQIHDLCMNAFLALECSCIPMRDTSALALVLQSHFADHSLRPIGTRAVAVTEVVVKKTSFSQRIPLVVRYPPVELSKILVFLHWFAESICDQLPANAIRKVSQVTPFNMAELTVHARQQMDGQETQPIDSSRWSSAPKALDDLVRQCSGVPMTHKELRKLACVVIDSNPSKLTDPPQAPWQPGAMSTVQMHLVRKAGHSLFTHQGSYYMPAVSSQDELNFELFVRNAWMTLVNLSDVVDAEMQAMNEQPPARSFLCLSEQQSPDMYLQRAVSSTTWKSTEQKRLLEELWNGMHVSAQIPCGAGKSFAFVLPSMAAERHGKFVLLLTPMRATAVSARQQADKFKVSNIQLKVHTFSNMLESVERLPGGLLIFSFDQALNDSVNELIMTLAPKICLVVVDEAHLLVEHREFRRSMHAGKLALHLHNKQYVFLSATLTDKAVRFLSDELLTHVDVSLHAAPLNPSVELGVQHIQEDFMFPRMENEIHRQLESVGPAACRCVVMCPTVALADLACRHLQDVFTGKNIALVTSETTLAPLDDPTVDILVGTSTISMSVNLDNLKLCVVLGTSYSLSETTQVFGRLARNGETGARGVFLFCSGLHEKIHGRNTSLTSKVMNVSVDVTMYTPQSVEKFTRACMSRDSTFIHTYLSAVCTGAEPAVLNGSQDRSQLKKRRRVTLVLPEQDAQVPSDRVQQPPVQPQNEIVQRRDFQVQQFRERRQHEKLAYEALFAALVKGCLFCKFGSCDGNQPSCSVQTRLCFRCHEPILRNRFSEHNARCKEMVAPKLGRATQNPPKFVFPPGTTQLCTICLAPTHEMFRGFANNPSHKNPALKFRIDYLYKRYRLASKSWRQKSFDEFARWISSMDSLGDPNAFSILVEISAKAQSFKVWDGASSIVP